MKSTRALLEAELSVARAPPAAYRSQFHQFPPALQSALVAPVRAFAGSDVWVYGAKETVAAKLGLLVMQLLGARVSEALHAGVSHILHIDAPDGDSSLDSLRAILPAFNLRLVLVAEPAAGSAAAVAAAPAGGQQAAGDCLLITLAWIEEQRQLQTQRMQRESIPMAMQE